MFSFNKYAKSISEAVFLTSKDDGDVKVVKGKKMKKILFNSELAHKLASENIAHDLETNSQYCKFEYTNGNSKVGRDTIIFNLGPARACPSATENLCELYANGLCYAENNEVTYKDAFKMRSRQARQWHNLSPEDIATSLAMIIIGHTKMPIKYVRVNESGDFRSLDDVTKLGEVVKLTNQILSNKGHENVTFYTYTHRSDLFEGGINPVSDVENLVIQGSGFRKDIQIKLKGKKGKREYYGAASKEGKEVPFFVDNCFTAMEYSWFDEYLKGDEETKRSMLPYGVEPSQFVQCVGDCFKCNLCKSKVATGKRGRLIAVIVHGTGSELNKKASATTRKVGKNIKQEGDLALSDQDIVQTFLQSSRNEEIFLNRLADFVRSGKMDIGQIGEIYKRLLYMRQDAKIEGSDKGSFEDVAPLLKPTRTFKGDLSQFIKDVQNKISKAKAKAKAKAMATPPTPPPTEEQLPAATVQESVKPKRRIVNLKNVPSEGLATLAMSGKLERHPQFLSPSDAEAMFEDGMPMESVSSFGEWFNLPIKPS